MTILCIETSTSCCSAAISVDGQTLASRGNLIGANHASELPVFIEQLLSEAKQNNWKLDAVALSQGPGSYTGLRIGTSIAKGLCYGLNIPLIPIDTLQILCVAAIEKSNQLPQNATLCPMLDARRMEVYTSFYTREGVRKEEVMAKIVDQTFLEGLTNEPIYFFGNGSEKCKEIIILDNAHFIDSIVPEAKYMDRLVEKSAQLDIKQLAYYEPFYLKEFVAAPSHIKGLK